jgi:uncharacterized lipoprotein YmbA
MRFLRGLIMKTRNFLRYNLAVIFLLSSGCTLFKTTPDRTRLFNIGFRGVQSAASSIDSSKIRLVLKDFPDYLDRPQIITKIGEHELKSNPRYRWATPLSETVLRIIRRRIQQNFPKIRIYEFPKDNVCKVDFTLQLVIDGLEISEVAQRVTFIGTWTFLDANQESMGLTPFEFCGSFADASDRYGEIVAQIEQVILHLGDAIVKQMDLILLKKETEK